MNKIIKALREGMVQQAIVGKIITAPVMAGHDTRIPVPMDTDRMLIKSIDVVSNKDVEFIVELFEDPVSGDSVYNSGTVIGRNYDVLDMIYIDQDARQRCYVHIQNNSDYECAYEIEIRGMRLK